MVYSAELGTYTLSELRTNKSINIIRNLSQDDASKKCVDDKRDNPGKALECIWRLDRDYTKPSITPISPNIPIVPISPISPVAPIIIIPPTLSVDKSEVTVGDTIIFKWDTKGGSGCYTTVDGVRSVNLSRRSGNIPVEDISPGTYAIGLNCPYGDIVKSAPIVIVTVLEKRDAKKINPITRDIVYKGSKTLDIFMPTNINTGAKVPVYLVVHGGGWQGGSKELYNAASSYYTDAGIAYVPINYTLASSTRSTSDLVYREIDCSLKWVYQNRDKYNFDVNQINMQGESAGGHLVLEYAMNQTAYNDLSCQWGRTQAPLNQVVAFSAPTDLTKDFSKTGWGNASFLVENFIGEKVNSNNFVKKARENSPVYSINKNNKNIKYYLYHGNNDRLVDYTEQAIALYNEMVNNKYSVIMDTSENTDHDTLIVNKAIFEKVFTHMKTGRGTSKIVMPKTSKIALDIIPPTLSVDTSEVTAGDTVTFKWDTKGGIGCYTTVDGKRSITLSGATGYSVSKDVSPGEYAIGLNCPYGNILKSAPIVIVKVKSVITPPTLSVDKSEVTAGDTVTFKWDANTGKDCYTTVKINNNNIIDTFVKDNKEKGINTGIIKVEDVSTGEYAITITCKYNGANRTSPPITVSVKNPVTPILGIREYGPYYRGDTITFDWIKNGGKSCYTTLNGNNATIASTEESGSIPIENVPAGDYTISMSCTYNKTGVTSTDLRTSDVMNVIVN